LDELALLVAALPERLRLMIELAAWCALRFGEVAELRRGDIDLKNGVIRVTRAVQWVDGTKIVAAPKADSARVVAFPPHIGEAAGRPTCTSMTFVTPEPLSRPRQAPRSPS
jgi:integrase